MCFFSDCDVIILQTFQKRLNPYLNGIFGQLARNNGLNEFEQFVCFYAEIQLMECYYVIGKHVS